MKARYYYYWDADKHPDRFTCQDTGYSAPYLAMSPLSISLNLNSSWQGLEVIFIDEDNCISHIDFVEGDNPAFFAKVFAEYFLNNWDAEFSPNPSDAGDRWLALFCDLEGAALMELDFFFGEMLRAEEAGKDQVKDQGETLESHSQIAFEGIQERSGQRSGQRSGHDLIFDEGMGLSADSNGKVVALKKRSGLVTSVAQAQPERSGLDLEGI